MDAALDLIRRAAPDVQLEELPAVDMPTLLVAREDILTVCRVLRDDPALQFALLGDVTAVDLYPAEPRYEVVYHLACLGAAYAQPGLPAPPARRLRLKARVPGDDARIASVTSVYPTAGWPEREVFDLMGIAFDHHPDLRRILTADGWEGHPLRKDYPVQVRKDTASWSPLQLSVDEFAANIRATRERATHDAGD